MKDDTKKMSTEKGVNKSRRKTLRNILAGTSVVGATATTEWQKPVIDKILLPAHAMTSIGSGDAGLMGSPS